MGLNSGEGGADFRLLCMGHARCYREDHPGLAVGISCIVLTLSSLVWGGLTLSLGR